MNSDQQEDKSAMKSHHSDKNDRKPLELLNVFGFNPNVPIINLTTNSDAKMFACASSHVLQIFSCQGNEQKCYMGHEHQIFVIDTDSTGRFIMSSDVQGVINIWDSHVTDEFPHPIRTIYEANDDDHEKLLKVSLSWDAKIILTVTEAEKGNILKLWQWSVDADKPNDFLEIHGKYGRVENVRFSKNINEMSMFVVSCTNGVIFGQWDSTNKKLLRHSPARAISISFRFVDTIFIENSDKAISITKCGSGVIWCNSILADSCDIRDRNFLYKKEFLKSIKLCESPLSVIKSIDESIIIADNNGKIRCYDQELKILFWFPSSDFNEAIVSISFDINSPEKLIENQRGFRIRDFLLQTRSEIFAVDFAQMKFNKIFYMSEDYITAFDIFPINKKQICCANYSGRLMMYDYENKAQVVEHQLKLLRRKSSMSDVEVFEIPHVSALAFSRNGYHLMAGLDNGTIINLDPTVLREIRYFNFTQDEILRINFSPDSLFVTFYDTKCNIIVFKHDKATDEEWVVLGSKTKYHTKAIVDTLYISKSSSLSPLSDTNAPPHQQNHHKLPVPRLISLGEDREIIEYDLMESMKEGAKNLSKSFSKRIFQTSIPTAITLIYNSKKHEEEILIADSKGKFKIFDKSTFEILATFMAPIYDSYVKQFDANTFAGLTPYSKFFIFSTNKNICLYAMPIDGNLFRSLGVVGHINGIKAIRVDSSRHFLFTIGHKCQSIFMWNINFEPLFEHLDEGGVDLEPYLNVLPGGKYGKFFQDMLDLYYYMLMLANANSIDDCAIKQGLDVKEIPDFMRGMGFFLSDYEIECINHELHLCGKRKVCFEDLIKLYINHAPNNPIQFHEMENAIKNVLDLNEMDSSEALVDRKSLIEILTCSEGEKNNPENAETYLKELMGNATQVFLSDFIKNSLKLPEHVMP